MLHVTIDKTNLRGNAVLSFPHNTQTGNDKTTVENPRRILQTFGKFSFNNSYSSVFLLIDQFFQSIFFISWPFLFWCPNNFKQIPSISKYDYEWKEPFVQIQLFSNWSNFCQEYDPHSNPQYPDLFLTWATDFEKKSLNWESLELLLTMMTLNTLKSICSTTPCSFQRWGNTFLLAMLTGKQSWHCWICHGF